MRHVVSMLALFGLLIGSLSAVGVTAQDTSLRDLLPTTDDIGSPFVVVDHRTRTLAEQAIGFANADEAARLLASWNWQENAFAVFEATQLTDVGTAVSRVDISLTRFADAEGASLALPYFLIDRAAVTGQHETKQLSQTGLGDELRVLNGPVEGGDDTTFYVRSGAILVRISAMSGSGGAVVSLEQIAQEIIDQVDQQSPSSQVIVTQSAIEPMPSTLPLDHAACFSIAGEGELDFPAVVARLAAGTDAAATLQSLGWQGGVYRQFTCKPPPGRIGWVDISLHQFADEATAARGVAYFSDSRARSMDLQPVSATPLGDSSAALTGPAVNGTEYSLYTSRGSQVFAITGVAPDSGSDPRADVEVIASALLTPNEPVPVAVTPTPTLIAPVEGPLTLAPLATATPPPPLGPLPTATSTPLPPPMTTPLPAAAAPLRAAIPTATPIPAMPPPPTAVPTLETVAIPTTAPPTPTPGPQPTATPRVIRPPTPGAG